MLTTPELNLPQNTLYSGFRYLSKGLGILLEPGMKRFVFIPILANILVFIILTIGLFQNFTALQLWLASQLPDWGWLHYIIAFLTAVFIFFILLIYGYSFTLLTNLIAAPFYGLMAERIEQRVTGKSFAQESVMAIIGRTLRRELIKLFYFITRGLMVMIGLFFLSFIPLLNLLVPILAFLWATWVMTLQYVDYPADNNHLPFSSMRERLKSQRLSTTSFGGIIMLGSMIPVINIFILPIAVAGGTLFWINELEQDALASSI